VAKFLKSWPTESLLIALRVGKGNVVTRLVEIGRRDQSTQKRVLVR